MFNGSRHPYSLRERRCFAGRARRDVSSASGRESTLDSFACTIGPTAIDAGEPYVPGYYSFHAELGGTLL